MSSRREVLIRILALLEDVNKTKKSHIKMLKTALFDCAINKKNVAVLTEDGAFALFFRPHPGGFDSSRGLKGWAQVELTDALFFIPKCSKSNVPIVIIHTRLCLQIRRRAFQVLIPFFKSFLDFKSLLGIVQLQAIHV